MVVPVRLDRAWSQRVKRRVFIGPAITLLVVVLFHGMLAPPSGFARPSIPLLLVVAASTYTGGLLSGFLSLVIASGYVTWFYLGPPGKLDPTQVERLLDFVVGTVAVGVMMGVLRRRAEAALVNAAELAVAGQYRTLFEEAAEPMLLSDRSHRFVFVNRRACELSGYSREELLRMRVTDLVSPSSQALRPLRLDEFDEHEQCVDRELRRRDGAVVLVQVVARRLADGATLAVVRDVSAEQAAVERIKNALSVVQATLESSTDGILVTDLDGKWVTYNRRFLEYWGIGDELAVTGGDGRAMADAMSRIVEPERFLDATRAAMAAPEEPTFDEVRMRDGRIFERHSLPQRIDGHVAGRVWTTRDVTEARRHGESMQMMQMQILHTEKMEAVGRLAGGIAHDFNNMLTAILGEADLLLLQSALEGQARAQVENIRSAAMRSAALTRQLLAYARRHHTEPIDFSAGELVRGLEPFIQRLAGNNVKVVLDLPEGGMEPFVHADPAHLEQALLNLVINAGDAMDGGGELTVRLHMLEQDPTRAPNLRGRALRLSVIDNGVGIPAEALSHLFEPFFTTKPPGKGTGLGLASVRGIVEQAHGTIEVESEPGRGAAFHITLPAIDAPATDAPEIAVPRRNGIAPAVFAPGLVPDIAPEPALPRPAAPPRRVLVASNGLSVLVVEDEAQVRHYVTSVLSSAGYSVIEAGDAGEAVELARGRGRAVDLLLTDVVMPGTNGPMLARQLVTEKLAGHVIFMSGYTGSVSREDLSGMDAGFIAKPFRASDLLDRVRDSIGC